MEIFKSKNSYFASTPQGLEEKLSEEFILLGATEVKKERGGVTFQSVHSPYRFVLQSRLASRLYQKLFSTKIATSEELYKAINSYSWPTLFSADCSFKVHTILGGGPLTKASPKIQQNFKNSLYLSQLAKDGVVDRFRMEKAGRPNVDTSHPNITLLLHLSFHADEEQFHLDVLTDLSGESLGNRFYREGPFVAPLKEPLAAGMVLLMNWNPQEEILIDSMCGSGTLLLEALMIKSKMPPSILRVEKRRQSRTPLWSLEYLKTFDHKEWQTALSEVEELHQEAILNLEHSPLKIYGFDQDSEALKLTRRHLARIGGNSNVLLKREDARTLHPPAPAPGIIFCNPPYGKRMQPGQSDALGQLYYDYGENLKKNFQGFRAYIFTAEMELRKQIQLRTTERIPLHNGPLESRLFHYNLY